MGNGEKPSFSAQTRPFRITFKADADENMPASTANDLPNMNEQSDAVRATEKSQALMMHFHSMHCTQRDFLSKLDNHSRSFAVIFL